MAALKLTLALTLVLGCGCTPSTHIEDFSALLQSAAGQGVNVEERWPSLSDTWNDVKDSVKDMTDKVGDIADGAEDRIQQAGDAVHRLLSNVAKKVAGALNKALGFVKYEADVLLNTTVAEKAKYFAEVNRTVSVGGEKVLTDFEKASNDIVTKLWTKWSSLREIVDRSADTIADGLSHAGQATLGKRLDTAVTAALESLDTFMTKLKEANDNLNGLGKKDLKEAESTLLMVNDKLNSALGYVAAFITKYEQAFQDIIDQISNAMVRVEDETDRVFATVQHNITEVAWRVRSASRELVLGMHQGIAATAKSQSLAVPDWKPVSAPTAPTAPTAPVQGDLKGAAFRQGAGLGLLMLLAAAPSGL